MLDSLSFSKVSRLIISILTQSQPMQTDPGHDEAPWVEVALTVKPQDVFHPPEKAVQRLLLLVFPPQHVVKLQDSYKVKVKSMGTLNIRVHQDIKDSWYLGKSFLGCFLSCGGSLRTASVILAANSTELLTGQNIEKLQEKNQSISSLRHTPHFWESEISYWALYSI